MSRSHRAARLIVASTIALVIVVTVPTAAAAQNGTLGRIARLPFDLLSKILMNDPAPVNVIIEAPQDVVDSLAQSYNVTIVKRLYSGAVISGTPAQLDAVAHDGRIVSMAVDRAVAAMQTVDTQATGANQVWPGLLKSGYTGSGVGVAVIDSGIAAHPDLNGRVYFCTTCWTRTTVAATGTATARTSPASSPATGPPASSRTRPSGLASHRARSSSTSVFSATTAAA